MIITQTPLRISLIGGGTDFRDFYSLEGGCVLSTAIDKYVFVIVKERFDEKIYINYSKKEIVDHVDEIEHDLVRESMRKAGVLSGVEITTLADIPSEGTGLGSSGSITVGLLNALYAYAGELVTAERLAREACEIEIDILGKPIGKQDQYIAAYGNVRFIDFKPDETVEVETINLNGALKRKLGANLLLFFTGKTRKADTILEGQKESISQKLDSLCMLKSLAFEMKGAIHNGDLDGVGHILNKGWKHKKQLSDRISNGQIDEIYNRALDAGALGGKISGAGGGGFLLLYCPRDKQDSVRVALSHLVELPFHLERDGSKVIFNMRRYEWK